MSTGSRYAPSRRPEPDGARVVAVRWSSSERQRAYRDLVVSDVERVSIRAVATSFVGRGRYSTCVSDAAAGSAVAAAHRVSIRAVATSFVGRGRYSTCVSDAAASSARRRCSRKLQCGAAPPLVGGPDEPGGHRARAVAVPDVRADLDPASGQEAGVHADDAGPDGLHAALTGLVPPGAGDEL